MISFMMRLLVLIILASWIFAPGAQAADRHAGYYNPKPKRIETYRARARVLQKSNKANRLAFVTGMATETLRRPYPPQYAKFAKGVNSEKLIIVSNIKGKLDTIYRVRALLATLTPVARKSPIFKTFKVEAILNFFDLAKMLGFRQITISDGDTYTHQVLLK